MTKECVEVVDREGRLLAGATIGEMFKVPAHSEPVTMAVDTGDLLQLQLLSPGPERWLQVGGGA